MARRTFFSFHYRPDVWRSWNVRNCWIVKPNEQQDVGFFDSGVFEASQRKGDDALKNFLRDGLQNTSVTCVLTGADTWRRRWVRYEIARSLVRGNGLLTVYIHGVKDSDGNITSKGADPLDQMAVYKTSDGKILLAEWDANNQKWVRYQDYTLEIPESDLKVPAPRDLNIVRLSKHYFSYDFTAQNGRENIGGWIETAAGLAKR